MLLAPDSTPLGTSTQATAILSGGDPTGLIIFRVFAANDSMCTTALSTQDPVSVDGIGAYPSGVFTAGAAGAYKWVAGYGGDALHAASATACNDPAGAFAVVAPPTVSAPATPQPSPLARRLSAQELASSCSPANLVLLSMTKVGRRVRFRGVADPQHAGQRVRIRGVVRQQSGFSVAAQSTVRPDGSFEATGRLPDRRSTTRTRYFAQLGDRKSPAVKLTRRLTARVTASTDAVTISGRVTPPLAKPIRRVRITRLTSCAAGHEVVARVKPDARGRFRVTLPRTPGAAPALYLAQTRVRSALGRMMRTYSNVLMTE